MLNGILTDFDHLSWVLMYWFSEKILEPPQFHGIYHSFLWISPQNNTHLGWNNNSKDIKSGPENQASTIKQKDFLMGFTWDIPGLNFG